LEHTLDSDIDSDEDTVAFDGQGRASGAPFESQYSEPVTIDTRIQDTAPSRSNNADLYTVAINERDSRIIDSCPRTCVLTIPGPYVYIDEPTPRRA
jgi:hypothetical protein